MLLAMRNTQSTAVPRPRTIARGSGITAKVPRSPRARASTTGAIAIVQSCTVVSSAQYQTQFHTASTRSISPGSGRGPGFGNGTYSTAYSGRHATGANTTNETQLRSAVRTVPVTSVPSCNRKPASTTHRLSVEDFRDFLRVDVLLALAQQEVGDRHHGRREGVERHRDRHVHPRAARVEILIDTAAEEPHQDPDERADDPCQHNGPEHRCAAAAHEFDAPPCRGVAGLVLHHRDRQRDEQAHALDDAGDVQQEHPQEDADGDDEPGADHAQQRTKALADAVAEPCR